MAAELHNRNLPLNRIRLQDDSIHVWLAHTDRLPSESRLASALTASEYARAENFRFPHDRTRFLRRREFLRGVLARYTGVVPDRLRFDCSEYGRPFLLGLDAVESVSFSTSHSDGLAAVCVGRSPLVGIDIEKEVDTVCLADEASMVLTPAEIAAVEQQADAVRPGVFLRFWTCKEAIVKAIGRGLSLPLDEIEIVDIESDCPRVCRIAEEYGPSSQWRLRRFTPAPGYAGAIAVKAESMEIEFRTWSPEDHVLACVSSDNCYSH